MGKRENEKKLIFHPPDDKKKHLELLPPSDDSEGPEGAQSVALKYESTQAEHFGYLTLPDPSIPSINYLSANASVSNTASNSPMKKGG